MLVISASPIVAPSVGGFASLAWGWQSVFVILIIVTILIVALVYFALPESKGPDPTFSLMPRDIIRSFLDVLKEPQFFTYAISGGIAFSGLFVFVSTSPFLYMTVYGLSEKEYSILFAVLVGGMIATSQSNRFLLKRYTSETLMSWAIPLQFIMSVLLLAVALLNMNSFYLQTGLLFLYLNTVGIILPNSSALTLAPFSSNTGTASSLMGALQLGFGALASFIVSITIKDTSFPMTITMAVTSFFALTALLVGRSFIKQVFSASGDSQPAVH
jgi:DHA1 family bicyclomycin/chloramphenicol resistance-like MFS transporter